MTELWMPCPSYPGYEASDNGRVRSVDRTIVDAANRTRRMAGRVLSQAVTPKGYLKVSPGRGVTGKVHQMVCEAFNGPRPTPAHEVRHLNGDSQDNRPENLVWGTASENRQDTLRHGTHNFAKRDECANGHRYTEANTYRLTKGGRGCRECRKHWLKENYRKSRAGAA